MNLALDCGVREPSSGPTNGYLQVSLPMHENCFKLCANCLLEKIVHRSHCGLLSTSDGGTGGGV